MRRYSPVVEAFGKLSAMALLALVLGLGPRAMIRLNEAWQWPQWRIPAGVALGGVLVVAALLVWASCTRVFARVGRGTPFIVEPTHHLVRVGLYGYSRNPIYVGHVAILCGWFLVCGHLTLLLYAAVWAAILHAVIVGWEEPHLRAQFGDDFVHYAQDVPRWLLVRPRGG
jgi:protein-S-isoprenylcysteine O-methyltransferase Ste14